MGTETANTRASIEVAISVADTTVN